MKKITLLVAVLALGLFFVSCNKEGQFTPKNKIDRIYCSSSYKYEVYNDYGYWETESTSSTSKYVSEIWNWDGKLLKSISHYDSDGVMNYTENYGYDGKRLTTISTGGSDRWVLNYEKEKLSSMEYYEGSEKVEVLEFSRDKGKISEIRITIFDYEKSAMTKFPVNALRFFIPAASTESFMKAMAKVNERHTMKSVYSYSWKLEWEGKNVSKLTYFEDAYTDTYEYTYDDKVNPYCGLFDPENFGFCESLSKNNVIRMVNRDSENYYNEDNYFYTYDGKVPYTKSYTYTYTSDYSRSTDTYNYYYEYK